MHRNALNTNTRVNNMATFRNFTQNGNFSEFQIRCGLIAIWYKNTVLELKKRVSVMD